MTLIYFGIFLVGILVLIVLYKILKRTGAKTPAALAEQIIRFPERSLLDIPLFINPEPAEGIGEFLKKTDNEIAQRGEFEMRRKFLQVFTQLLEKPSINRLKNFTNFLFDDSAKHFQTTLHWEGRCNSALAFLRLMKVMCESLEAYRSPGVIRKSFTNNLEEVNKTAENTLGGTDRQIAGEWERLLAAFYRKSDMQKKKSAKSKKSKSSKKRKSKSKKILLPESLLSEKNLPVFLDEPGRVPHLLQFQKVARDVLMQYRQIYNEQR